MGLDLWTAGFIDRQQPPAPAAHGPIGRDDIAVSVGAMTVSMKRGNYVSGATSIFVADRYVQIHGTLRILCVWLAAVYRRCIYLDLDLIKLRRQACNGAGSMSAPIRGTAALITAQYPLVSPCLIPPLCLTFPEPYSCYISAMYKCTKHNRNSSQGICSLLLRRQACNGAGSMSAPIRGTAALITAQYPLVSPCLIPPLCLTFPEPYSCYISAMYKCTKHNRNSSQGICSLLHTTKTKQQLENSYSRNTTTSHQLKA